MFINTHLHNPMEEWALGDYLRAHQTEQLLHWMKKRESEVKIDKVFAVGDFNSEPDSTTYRLMKEAGFLSAYEQIHGQEPVETFRSCIEAPFADPDPNACFDYVFFKGDGLSVTDA